MKHFSKYTCCGLFAILFWSTLIAVGRSLTEQLGAFTTVGYVYLISGILYFLYTYKTQGKQLALFELPKMSVLGCTALFTLYLCTLYLAIEMAVDRKQLLEIGLINYLWPTLTIIFSLILLNKKASIWLALGILSATTGVFLVLTQAKPFEFSEFINNLIATPLPYLLAFGSAILWALYSCLTRRWLGDKASGAILVYFLTSGIIFTFLSFVLNENSIWNSTTIYELLYMIFAASSGYALWDLSMRKGDVVIVAAASYFTPFLSTLVAAVYLNVQTTNYIWYGCALIIFGAIICKLSVKNIESI